MKHRLCVCGKRISWRRPLCKACRDEYGHKRADWPEWLKQWVKDVQNEIDADRRHDELEIYDEAYPSEGADPVGVSWGGIDEFVADLPSDYDKGGLYYQPGRKQRVINVFC